MRRARKAGPGQNPHGPAPSRTSRAPRRPAAGPPQQIGADRRHGARSRQPRIVGHPSSAASPAGKPSRNPMASARFARTIGESAICEQPVVGRADRRPVGLLPAGRRRVHRGDHGLRQIRPVCTRGQLQALHSVGDPAAVPSAAVLFVERHQCAVVVHPGGSVANHAAAQGRPMRARHASRASARTPRRPAGLPRRTARRESPTVPPSTSSPR